jgi:hypothetical protein
MRELFESISRKKSEYIFPAKGGGPRKDIAKERCTSNKRGGWTIALSSDGGMKKRSQCLRSATNSFLPPK